MADTGKTSLKVNRSITGATTVNANSYAIVNYNCTSVGGNQTNGQPLTGGGGNQQTVVRYFGPAASIPATFTSLALVGYNGGNPSAPLSATITYTLQSGVEFINS